MSDSFLQSVWCVVPVYNNPATVTDVVRRCCEQLPNVLVVDDGSDQPVEKLLADLPVTVLRNEENRGKGKALLTALRYIEKQGGAWMVAIDADGQHDPADLKKFLPALQAEPNAIHIGARDFSVPNVPKGSRFGRKFSNGWIKLECGATISDSQSGFRAYPVRLLSQMKFRGRRYDFEVEVLTKAVWYGLSLTEIPVHVVYPPKEERVSHFSQWKDNLRLTHRHAMLMSRRLLPWPHPRLIPPGEEDWRTMVRHPRKFLAMLLKENSSSAELSFAAGTGLLLATLPLIACHTIAILYAATRLKLNRLLALNVQHLCAPPFVPLACIWLGFFLRTGSMIGLKDLRNIAENLPLHLLDWLIGSLVLAPAIGALGALAVYFISHRIQKERAT